MITAFTLGNERGSEGKSVPAADWRAAKSLLRSNIESRLFMLILPFVSYEGSHSGGAILR
jgi:hypothetical protein